MRYGNRPLWRRILTSPFTLVVVLIVLIFTWRGAVSIREKAQASQARLNQARAQLAKLQSRQSELSNQISYLSTDEGKEAEVRNKYHAILSGESVAVIIGNDQVADAAMASTTFVEAPERWWQKILDLVGL